MIKIIDDIFTEEENKKFYDHFISLGYFYGETDHDDYPPTGMMINLSPSEDNTVKEILEKIYPIIINEEGIDKNEILFRTYVNLFLPKDVPYYHRDNTSHTVMIYILNPLNKEIVDGGETLYVNENNLTVMGVLPKVGRLVIHDGSVLHKANPCRVYPRLSLIFRFYKP